MRALGAARPAGGVRGDAPAPTPGAGESVEAWARQARYRGAAADGAARAASTWCCSPTIGATRPRPCCCRPCAARGVAGPGGDAARDRARRRDLGAALARACRARRSRPTCAAIGCATSTTTATPTRASRATACGSRSGRRCVAAFPAGRGGARRGRELGAGGDAPRWPSWAEIDLAAICRRRRARRRRLARAVAGAAQQRAARLAAARAPAGRRPASLVERLLRELPTARQRRAGRSARGELRATAAACATSRCPVPAPPASAAQVAGASRRSTSAAPACTRCRLGRG